jgi:hypothetical protein
MRQQSSETGIAQSPSVVLRNVSRENAESCERGKKFYSIDDFVFLLGWLDFRASKHTQLRKMEAIMQASS